MLFTEPTSYLPAAPHSQWPVTTQIARREKIQGFLSVVDHMRRNQRTLNTQQSAPTLCYVGSDRVGRVQQPAQAVSEFKLLHTSVRACMMHMSLGIFFFLFFLLPPENLSFVVYVYLRDFSFKPYLTRFRIQVSYSVSLLFSIHTIYKWKAYVRTYARSN